MPIQTRLESIPIRLSSGPYFQGCPQENDAYCFLCGTSSLNSEWYLSD